MGRPQLEGNGAVLSDLWSRYCSRAREAVCKRRCQKSRSQNDVTESHITLSHVIPSSVLPERTKSCIVNSFTRSPILYFDAAGISLLAYVSSILSAQLGLFLKLGPARRATPSGFSMEQSLHKRLSESTVSSGRSSGRMDFKESFEL
jgi:hypothetical protein